METIYEPVIGLEVHAQLNTATKIFCGCSTRFAQEPNSAVCPVCLGYPGVLPVMNEAVIRLATKVCMLFDFKINKVSKLDRKNYFYPDLPKGYQISQFDLPIGVEGHLIIQKEEGPLKLAINRVHMEEDAGKLLHAGTHSQVDFNRTGVPLLEIVSEPVMHTSEEAVLYLKKMKQILQYAEISDCNMEEGSLRCDANISIRPKGEQGLGTKTEIKNLNSFKFVQKALDYEINRHIQVVREGGRIVQETRLFDVASGKTRPMRSKEEAHDYRYFPEPDLVPTVLNQEWIDQVAKELPESPVKRFDRFQQDYALSPYDAEVLTAEKELADYFEETCEGCKQYKLVANWIMSELIREWRDHTQTAGTSSVSPEQLAALLNMIDSGKINGKIGKEVLPQMFLDGKSAESIVAEKGLGMMSDDGELEKIVQEVVAKNPQSVDDFRNGKTKAIGFLVGQVMKATRGKADPAKVNQLLQKGLQ